MEPPIRQPITAQDLTGRAFASVERRMKGLEKVSGLVSGKLGAIGSALTVGAIVGVGKAALDAADGINDMSQRLGVSTEALSQYQHVAKMSGTDFETLAKGIQLASKTVSEAARGSKAAAEALGEVGLKVADLKGLKPDQAFEVIGEAISRLPSEADRTAMAMKLLGKSGVELIPVFANGAAGVRELRDEADRLGLTLDSLSAEKVGKANDAIDRMKGAFSGLVREISVEAAPALESIATRISEALAAGNVREAFRDAWKAAAEAPPEVEAEFKRIFFAAADPDEGKAAALRFWRGFVEGSRAVQSQGIFLLSTQAPLFPGMTEEGKRKAKEYAAESVAAMLQGLKSVEVATDGLTESERSYFMAIERSIQLAQQRQIINDSALDSGLVELMDLDETTRQNEADALERHYREVQRAVDEYERLKRESQLTWQMMSTGIDMVSDQLSNNLAAAVMGARRKLIDLASIAETLLGMAFRYAISAGVNVLFPGAGYVAAGTQGPTQSGAPLGKSMSAIPGPISGGVTVVQNVTVTGTVDANNPLSVRRLAAVLYDEQLKIQKHHGPMGAAG